MRRLSLALLALLAGGAAAPAQAPDCLGSGASAAVSQQVAEPAPGEIRRARTHRPRADRQAGAALGVVEGSIRIIDAARLLDGQFIRFDAGYLEARAARRARLDGLKLRLDAAQHPGHWLYCSQQLYDDAEWLIEYTAHWARADAALDRLERSLGEPEQAAADGQGTDGSWGGCRGEWIFRLDRTVDAFNAMAPAPPPRLERPLAFLERISTTADIGHLLMSRAISAIAATGIYGREEQSSLDESLPQLLFKPRLTAIARDNGAGFVTPDYVERYTRLVDAMQDPLTGFWGPVLLADGERLSMPDLSMTFHIVSYRRGCVALWPRILDTLLAMKPTDYPYGWRSDGRVTAHNAYDVVRLLALGWGHANARQRETARADIGTMLRDVLDNAVQPDGSVRFDPAYYETEAAAYYFAVAFLDEAGFWRPTKRFWTSDHAVDPAAADLCLAMKERVRRLRGESALGLGALQRLAANCP
jgi:hypothetical protein